MSYNLFLDDCRVPRDVTWIDLPLCDWIVVRSYRDFVKIIKERGLPLRITFDHDLSLEHYPLMEKDDGIKNPTKIPYENYKEKTGFDCAKFLIEYCMSTEQQIPPYQVHSMNFVGKQNIISVLECYKKNNQNID